MKACNICHLTPYGAACLSFRNLGIEQNAVRECVDRFTYRIVRRFFVKSDRLLGKYDSDKLAGFSTEDGGSVKASVMDEPLCELLGKATTEREEQAVRDYQHFALLYRYRNSLVHESREPGTGMEVFASTGDPYYHGYINDPKWYLVYPTNLFQVLLTRAIAGFRAYLVENSLDPYALVEDKARW